MMEITTGAIAGVVGASVSETLHNEPNEKGPGEYLSEILQTLKDIHTTFKQQPQTHKDQHETVMTWTTQAIPVRYESKGFLACFLLVQAACTLAISISGIGTFNIVFAAAPTAGQFPIGQYVRWRYPEGATLQVVTSPAPVSTYWPIEFLYTNDAES